MPRDCALQDKPVCMNDLEVTARSCKVASRTATRIYAPPMTELHRHVNKSFKAFERVVLELICLAPDSPDFT